MSRLARLSSAIMTTATGPELSQSTNFATVIRPGDRRSYWLGGDLGTPLVTADMSGGNYDLLHTRVFPGGGPPPHIHRNEDELFYVIDGSFAFVLGDQTFTAGAGACFFLPRGVVHTFRNIGEQPGHLIVAATPSGFLDFADDVATLCTDPHARPEVTPAEIEKLNSAATRHGIELMPQWKTHPAAAPVTKPQELWVIGLHIKILLGGERTRGQMSVVEITTQPGDFVPPHYHEEQDEMFYVLEGTTWFELGEGSDSITATPGTLVHIPRGTVHAFRNIGSKRGKMLNYHTPGGFEKFFQSAGTECRDIKLGPPKTAPNFAKFAMICRDHGMVLPQ